MKMLDYQNSAVAKMAKSHPELAFASKATTGRNLFGDESPTMLGVGLGNKLGAKKSSNMNQSVAHSKVMRAMKFIQNRIGG